MEGLGIVALGFLGAEALFAPGADGVPVIATLLPAIALGVAVCGYRIFEMTNERAEQDESVLALAEDEHNPDQPDKGVRPLYDGSFTTL